MQAFGLTKMQFLKIILLQSVFVLSSVLDTGMLHWAILFFIFVPRCVFKNFDLTESIFLFVRTSVPVLNT